MLQKAIEALTRVVAKRSANSNPLFSESSETMAPLCTLGTVPDRRRVKFAMVRLPHPMFDDKAEVCFVSKTPQKKYRELLLQTHPVPGLTKVPSSQRRHHACAERGTQRSRILKGFCVR